MYLIIRIKHQKYKGIDRQKIERTKNERKTPDGVSQDQ